MQDFAASFWNYIRLELKRRDVDVGFAALAYCGSLAQKFLQRDY